MTAHTARQTIKAINRHVRRRDLFAGGRSFGVDFTTWHYCHTHLSTIYLQAAEILTGRKGRFMPPI